MGTNSARSAYLFQYPIKLFPDGALSGGQQIGAAIAEAAPADTRVAGIARAGAGERRRSWSEPWKSDQACYPPVNNLKAT